MLKKVHYAPRYIICNSKYNTKHNKINFVFFVRIFTFDGCKNVFHIVLLQAGSKSTTKKHNGLRLRNNSE